jgi:pyruvate dehydrogenase E2 component (dihydrolipoamide acetyltransferase)
MATAISMPSLGMTMEEGTIVDWPLEVGAAVARGDIVLVIETEKTETEIEAPASGILRHVYVETGETVPCGALLAAITETADEAFDAEAFRAAEDRTPEAASGGLQVRSPGRPAGTTTSAKPTVSEAAPHPVAPAARAAAKKLGLDPQRIPGTGPGGRVTKQDVEAFAAAREALVPVADGVALEVLKTGAGDAVVLLPGLGTDVSAFVRQTALLAERFHVHGVNPRGVGHSDAPALDAYDVTQTAADAAASYEGAAHVIGASLGAAAALELALAHPERVETLTLITPFVEASARLVAVGRGWQRMAAEARPETLAAALMPWFFSTGLLSDEAAYGRTMRGLAQTLARVPASTVARMVAGLERWSGTRVGDLAGLSVPTLVIGASEDLLSPGAEAIAGAIPGARLVIVEDAGHAVALEAADAVNAAISAHLK